MGANSAVPVATAVTVRAEHLEAIGVIVFRAASGRCEPRLALRASGLRADLTVSTSGVRAFASCPASGSRLRTPRMTMTGRATRHGACPGRSWRCCAAGTARAAHLPDPDSAIVYLQGLATAPGGIAPPVPLQLIDPLLQGVTSPSAFSYRCRTRPGCPVLPSRVDQVGQVTEAAQCGNGVFRVGVIRGPAAAPDCGTVPRLFHHRADLAHDLDHVPPGKHQVFVRRFPADLSFWPLLHD